MQVKIHMVQEPLANNFCQDTVSSCTSISSFAISTQHENTFLSFLCHPHKVVYGLCNPETHLKKDFQIT